MTRIQRTALVCLLLSCGFSVFEGFYKVRNSPSLMLDFSGVYYNARCLLQHADPYKIGEPLRAYLADGGERPMPPVSLQRVLIIDEYLPTTSIIIAPFAMLPWGPAHMLWMIFTAGSLVFAGFLMWSLGAKAAPVLSGVLICLILANSAVLVATGNSAGIVVSLCVVAVWCFLHDRFVWAGIVCLAASLAIKPHDAGLVWLYFLLAGGVYRKRALQVLVVTAVIGLAAIVWVTPIAPHWMQEWQSNLLAESVPGGPSNPGPTNASCSGPGMIIDLQAVMSVFRDDPRIYNPASYLLCGALLLTWSVRTLRSRFSQARAWIALAAVVPLTMVVTYHRSHDAKLLLLAVPACAMLWAEGRPIRWVALVVSSAAIVCTADIPLTILLTLTRNLHISTVGISGKMLTVVLTRPVPLILLAMSIFYLWIYTRRDPQKGSP